MANWCNNTVHFYGSKESILSLENRIEQSDKSEGISIHSSDVIDGYFFDITLHDSSEGLTIGYESKWVHNFGDVAAICKEFNLIAHSEFEEPGIDYYGKCDYQSDGTFEEFFVSEFFFQEVEFNYETDQYDYRGGSWDYVDDLIQDEYFAWLKELLQTSDKDTAEIVMQISDSCLKQAVGTSHEDAEAIVRLITSTDVENVMLGLTFYNSIIKF